jgi:predicted alternative tryptophan synthase beta-subunit
VRRFARTQGPVAAQGTGYAVRATVDEALLAREEGVARVVLFAWSG